MFINGVCRVQRGRPPAIEFVFGAFTEMVGPFVLIIRVSRLWPLCSCKDRLSEIIYQWRLSRNTRMERDDRRQFELKVRSLDVTRIQLDFSGVDFLCIR